MARVITFSDHMMFDKSIPTYFVQSFIAAMTGDPNYVYTKKYLKKLFQLNAEKMFTGNLTGEMLESFHAGLKRIKKEDCKYKIHTIRKGDRWEAGDMASPRVWQETPFNTPQIILWDDVKIQKTYGFEVRTNRPESERDKAFVYFNDRTFLLDNDRHDQELLETIAANDGLSVKHFNLWFNIFDGTVKKVKADHEGNVFGGQIICWQDPHYK